MKSPIYTRAGSPQQHEPITVGPYYLTPLSTFLVGGNRSTWRKPTTFGRALTILFSHEDWVRVHIKMNLTGDQTQNLRGERQVVWPYHNTHYCCWICEIVCLNVEYLNLFYFTCTENEKKNRYTAVMGCFKKEKYPKMAEGKGRHVKLSLSKGLHVEKSYCCY